MSGYNGGKGKPQLKMPVRRVFFKHKVTTEFTKCSSTYKAAITSYSSNMVRDLAMASISKPSYPFITEFEPVMKDKNCYLGNKITLDIARASILEDIRNGEMVGGIPAYMFYINNDMEIILVGTAYNEEGKELTPTQFYNTMKAVLTAFVTTKDPMETLEIEIRACLIEGETKVIVRTSTEIKKFLLVI